MRQGSGSSSAAPDKLAFSGEYWRFWWASTLSNLGDGMRLTAGPLLAASLTSHPLSIALVATFGGLPWLLVSPFAGALIDRHDRRRLLLIGHIGRGITVGVLAAWLLFGAPPLAVLYVVVFLMVTGEVLVDNASQAAVPHLAPTGPGGLDAANGRLLASQTVFENVVGAPVGAAAFAIGAALPFLSSTVAFALCAALLAFIRTPLQSERAPVTTSMWTDVRAGVVALWRSPLLRRLAIAGGFFNICLTGAYAVFVLLVLDVHGGSPLAFGILLSVGAVGGLLGSLLAGRAARRIGRRHTLVIVTAVAAVGLVGLGLAPSLLVIGPLHLMTIACLVTYSVIAQSIRQAATPDHLLGRVVASFRMIGYGGIPIGGLLAGIVATATSVRSAFVIFGVAAVIPLIAVIAAVRHLDPAANR